MPRWLRTILIVCFLISPLPAGADESLVSILQGVQKRYGGLPGLSLPYERQIITKSMALLGDQMKSDFAAGRIFFKPPHSLRIEQEKPAPESVISDGDTLWWYNPKKSEVFRYKSSKLGHELKLLGEIFQGLRGVEESFMVVLAGSDEGGNYRLELTPKAPWPDITHILLTVARGDYRITVMEIHNVIGGLTRFALGPPTARKTFEPGFFHFEAPEGVRIIEGEG
ncbi:MAG: outer membrane lipoprotein carrier protein LolA [Thermodesulfobacteriota bacterium]